MLLHCSAVRADNTLRAVHPELTATFAAHHDASLRRCLSLLLNVDPSTMYWDLASLPLSLGGLGLRGASLTSQPAYWSSWADCLGMVQQGHSTVSLIVHALDAQHPVFHVAGLRHWSPSGSSWFSNTDLGGACRWHPASSDWRGAWTRNQVCLVMAGNEPPQFPSMASRLKAPSNHHSHHPKKRYSDLKESLCRVSLALASQPPQCRRSAPLLSVCCFSDFLHIQEHFSLHIRTRCLTSFSSVLRLTSLFHRIHRKVLRTQVPKM